MILPEHLPYYREIFDLPGFPVGPVLSFGFQEIHDGAGLGEIRYQNLEEYFAARGVEAHSLDLFDPRARYRHDMNHPVPPETHGAFGTLMDIGSLEHVFDTRQCMENCMRMIRMGGYYMLHTPVNGYCGHGLHVFNALGLKAALHLNGFRIIYRRYSGRDGFPLESALAGGDVIQWMVAVKVSEVPQFVAPQQGVWQRRYSAVLENTAGSRR